MEIANEEWKKADVVWDGKSFVFFHKDENDHIFSSIRNSKNFYELELLNVLGALLRPGDCVVDVGANIGNHAVYFAGVCGCRVLAFEPNPAAAETLRKNIETNGLEDRIQVYEVALGSQTGSGNLVVPVNHNLGMVSVEEVEGGGGSVRIDPLSNYVGSAPVRLIKIDAEGMDYQVLAGAEDVLARDGCAVSIEAATREEYLKIDALMERHGYVAAGSHNYTPTHLFLHQRWDESQSFMRWMSRQISLDYIDRAIIREALNRGRRETSSQIEHANEEISSQVTRATSEISSQVQQANREISSQVEETKRGLDSIASAIRDLEERVSRRVTDVIQVVQEFEKRVQDRYNAGQQLTENLSSEMTSWKDEIKALFQCTVLAAEVDNLHEAVQAQEQVWLIREVQTLKQRAFAELQQVDLVSHAPRPAGEDITSTMEQKEKDQPPPSSAVPPSLLDEQFARGVIVSQDVVRHKELVSLIIPSYNNEDWLTRAINSALSQRGVKVEILVVDDGSTDNSVTLARAISNEHKNVRVISLLRNFGCYYARNIGVMNATGDYVTILDSDDIMSPDRVALQLDALKSSPNSVACQCRLRRWTGDFSRPLNELRYGENSLLWRREIVETMGGYDTVRFGGDTEFRMRLQANFGPAAIVRIPDELYYLRTTESSLTNTRGSEAYSIESGNLKPALSPERQSYAKNLEEWHRGPKPLTLEFPQFSRPFALGSGVQNASPSLGQRRIGAMASFPPRRESLKATIESILPQLDELILYLNDYDDIPEFAIDPKIRAVRSHEARGDLRDNGKFYDLPSDNNSYLFTFDDDIIYPKDYTARMIHYIETLNRTSVVGLHGVIFPEGEFHSLSQRTVYHFAFKQDGYFVDLLGTGTTAWHSSTMKLSLDDFGSTGVCDLWFAAAAAKREVPLFSIPREKGWLRVYANFEESLYQEALSHPQRYFDTYRKYVAPVINNGSIRRGVERKLAINFERDILTAAGIRLSEWH
ncbi:FkbM family methyltransferase [Ciceribacter ferrooxidans]|uniref:FkbM family methyltransferase n=1 Tax=Ciceribacter ferrooxidans TaxID=2509717 RepID=A0A4Q2T591_9HYPH|nr:FkbM family methyltransferase [Ciceribacter ferrooxidans]RYC13956.1 FkbM family methyltransferase [Ciceribacter ferrooxidans]